MKNLLTAGSLLCTATAVATTPTPTEVLDPNSINLVINAILTIITFVLRFLPKKGGRDEKA